MTDATAPAAPEPEPEPRPPLADRLARLTIRQRMVYDYIKAYLAEHGCAPTVREIAAHFGISSLNGVLCHLRLLERAGVIRRHRYRHRVITLLD